MSGLQKKRNVVGILVAESNKRPNEIKKRLLEIAQVEEKKRKVVKLKAKHYPHIEQMNLFFDSMMMFLKTL